MTDPRIKRTREHVLRTARQMLAQPSGAPLTLSALAAQAQVSRRTLYVHWGTIQQVISDAVSFELSYNVDPTGLSARGILRQLLHSLRTSIHEPTSNVALATMLNQAAQDDAAASVLRATATTGRDKFAELVGPITLEQYAQLVGPIMVYEFVLRERASDGMIESIVEHGATMLGLPAD